MKNKLGTKILLILMIIACSYQYLLMLPTYSIEQKIENGVELALDQYDDETRALKQKEIVQEYLDSIANDVIFQLPYLAEYTYSSLKKQQLKLGLDLQGGMQVNLGFDEEKFIKELANGSKDKVFLDVLERTKQATQFSRKQFIPHFFELYQQEESKKNIVHFFSVHTLIDNEKVSTYSGLINYIEQSLDETISKTKFLIEQRLNSTGVAQANVRLDKKRNLIHVELPGITDRQRIRDLITNKASLAFWDVYRVTDHSIMDGFIAADESLKRSEN